MRLQEIVVVEGLHDKQAVETAVDAHVWVIGGDRLAHRFLAELRRASEHRGVIVLTDPDGTGERIRRRIDDEVPHCKHAFLSRKQAGAMKNVPSLGIEHASAEDIRAALFAAKPTLLPSEEVPAIFSAEDLEMNGLVGTRGSAERRTDVGDVLGIGYGNAKAFLRKLNVLGITREEFNGACAVVESKGEVD